MVFNFVNALANVLKFMVIDAQNCAAIAANSSGASTFALYFVNVPSGANSKAITTPWILTRSSIVATVFAAF